VHIKPPISFFYNIILGADLSIILVLFVRQMHETPGFIPYQPTGTKGNYFRHCEERSDEVIPITF